MKVRVYDIDWDIDPDDDITLPEEVCIDVEIFDLVEEKIVDRVSDMYGYCINSCVIDDPDPFGNAGEINSARHDF